MKTIKIKVNKKLLLESYLQDLMDGMSNEKAVELNGIPQDRYIQDERYLDKDKIIPEGPKPSGTFIPPKFPNYNLNSIELIRAQQHDQHLPFNEKVLDNIHTFTEKIGNIENSGKTHGENIPVDDKTAKTTAKGLYQFTDENTKTGASRIIRDHPKIAHQMEWPKILKNINISKSGVTTSPLGHPENADDLDRQQQTNLLLGNIYGHGNGTGKGRMMYQYLGSGQEPQQELVYEKIHHTDTAKNPIDTKTLNREKQEFGFLNPRSYNVYRHQQAKY